MRKEDAAEITAERVREDLRFETDDFLRRRRAIVALSLFSASVLSGVALFQMGIAKRLPDLPLAGFDAEKVHGSRKAYALFGIPDALLGVASYALTACLAGAGPANRSQTSRAIPVTMAVKAGIDVANAARLTATEWSRFRSLSIYSLAVAGATAVVLPLAIPEAGAALR